MSFFKNTRNLVATGILGAIGAILMLLNLNIPSIMPVFIKFDFSELPSIIAAFAYGPIGGIMVCLVKNVLNLIFASNTAGVGKCYRSTVKNISEMGERRYDSRRLQSDKIDELS